MRWQQHSVQMSTYSTKVSTHCRNPSPEASFESISLNSEPEAFLVIIELLEQAEGMDGAVMCPRPRKLIQTGLSSGSSAATAVVCCDTTTTTTKGKFYGQSIRLGQKFIRLIMYYDSKLEAKLAACFRVVSMAAQVAARPVNQTIGQR